MKFLVSKNNNLMDYKIMQWNCTQKWIISENVLGSIIVIISCRSSSHWSLLLLPSQSFSLLHTEDMVPLLLLPQLSITPQLSTMPQLPPHTPTLSVQHQLLAWVFNSLNLLIYFNNLWMFVYSTPHQLPSITHQSPPLITHQSPPLITHQLPPHITHQSLPHTLLHTLPHTLPHTLHHMLLHMPLLFTIK